MANMPKTQRAMLAFAMTVVVSAIGFTFASALAVVLGGLK